MPVPRASTTAPTRVVRPARVNIDVIAPRPVSRAFGRRLMPRGDRGGR
jgi:hypothetical protein